MNECFRKVRPNMFFCFLCTTRKRYMVPNKSLKQIGNLVTTLSSFNLKRKNFSLCIQEIPLCVCVYILPTPATSSDDEKKFKLSTLMIKHHSEVFLHKYCLNVNLVTLNRICPVISSFFPADK